MHRRILINIVIYLIYFLFYSPGKSFQQNGMHVHDLQQFYKSTDFDFSHIIHSISFGRNQERIFNPLDNTQKETKICKLFFFFFFFFFFLNFFFIIKKKFF